MSFLTGSTGFFSLLNPVSLVNPVGKERMLKILPRHQINTDAWNACVVASSQRIVYGYSWYLDAVLPAPSWKWVGLVIMDQTGAYQVVMPIPLRRKQLAGITYEWVVHQPFFCQSLAVFNRDPSLDLTPFFRAMQLHFHYGSIFTIRHQAADPSLTQFPPQSHTFRPQTTHILDLSVGYKTLSQNYTHDRSVNLRRAERFGWTVSDSGDPEPLLSLFRENHAATIVGGVANWAYDIFRNLTNELSQRGLATLRYAIRDGRIEAGALFVREGNWIIYLFNAASEIGRRGNARTLLIDQIIRENAGCRYAGEPLVFDFESPEKPSIREFYRSFGAVEELLWTIHWNRLTTVERMIQRVRNSLKKASATN